MTSKKELTSDRDAWKRYYDQIGEELGKQSREQYQFRANLLLLEPQLKHYLTDGSWDFDRIHRAAEHLRGEDALASVGYTDQCVWPDNVTPLFPHDPSDGYGAA